jgi:indole-3-glycerol phosphate synthase
MSILDEIVKKKKERLDYQKSRAPLRELKALLADAEPTRDFKAAITLPRESQASEKKPAASIKLIAELKKASPSRGLIRANFNPREIAGIYDRRADAISVLTEEDFFQGDLRYIAEVKSVSKRPVLRKDFIFDEYQIYESRAAGADAILLIESVLETSQAGEYLHMAGDLGMAVLFEVHDLRGLEKAIEAGAGIIGVNNRDLKTLDIDLNTTFKLKREMPGDRTVVSESGISRRADVKRLMEAGIDAMLIGTAFMESGDMEARMEELMPSASGNTGRG